MFISLSYYDNSDVIGKSFGIKACADVEYMAEPTPSVTRRNMLAIMNTTAEGISTTNLHASIITNYRAAHNRTHASDMYEVPTRVKPPAIGRRTPTRGNCIYGLR